MTQSEKKTCETCEHRCMDMDDTYCAEPTVSGQFGISLARNPPPCKKKGVYTLWKKRSETPPTPSHKPNCAVYDFDPEKQLGLDKPYNCKDEAASLTLDQLCDEAYATSVSKGWYDEEPVTPRPKGLLPESAFILAGKLALVHSEVSEALEAYRERGLEEWFQADGKPEGVAAEFADVLLRIGDMCRHYEIDLVAAVKRKMAYNKTRPHRHGGKRL